MIEHPLLVAEDTTAEVTALIETLHETARRLEELTGGEIDSVADRDGRTILLGQAQEQLRQTEAAKQSAILDALPAYIALLDTQGVIVSANESWRQFTGRTVLQHPGYEIGVNYLNVCDSTAGKTSSDARAISAGIRTVLDGAHDSISIEYSSHTQAEERWFLLSVTTLTRDRRTGVVVMHVDITKQKLDADQREVMEATLFAEREQAQVTLNSIGDAVACTNIAGNITFLNVVAERMTGWSLEEAAGQPVGVVLRILDATSYEVVADPMGMAVESDQPLHLPPNCILMRRDGVEIPIEDSVAPIHNREGNVSGAVIVFRDVTAAREMSAQMAHAARHDFLTGLPNRMRLDDRIGQAVVLAQRHDKKVAVLFLDLDGFKHINDSLGHPVGDQLLRSVAQRLVDCVRASDTVGRTGGDEFVIILSEIEQSDNAAMLAKRILESVADTHFNGENHLHITASIGVSIFPDDGLDAETLIKNADTAMYQAKAAGRSSFQFFKPDMNVRAVERQSIEESMRRALQRDEFTLVYQPKVCLTTGAIVGAEALIRWTTLTRGNVSPAQFIPIAEECGLIVPIGNWVLHEACRQARSWVNDGLPPITMAVNVSAVQFREKNFLANLCDVLSKTGLDPRSLELEVTEGLLMQHVESSASILNAAKERGIRIAIDDFGTGYSSLSYLRKFPVDALKIDQAFVRQISAGDTAIVTAVIAMARSLNLRVVAEGVETRDELTFLQEQHCDEAQGYYFSRPVGPQQFAKLLQGGARGADPVPHGGRQHIAARASVSARKVG